MQGQGGGEQLTDLDRGARERMYIADKYISWHLVEEDDDFTIWFYDSRQFGVEFKPSGSWDYVLEWGPGNSAGSAIRITPAFQLQSSSQRLDVSFDMGKRADTSYGTFELSLLDKTISGNTITLRCRMLHTVNTGAWHFTDNAPHKDFTLSCVARAGIYVNKGSVGSLVVHA